MLRRISSLLLLLCAVLIPYPVSAAPLGALPDLATFKASVVNGDSHALRGVYVEGLFALPILQQAPMEPGYVSRVDGTATQFNMAAQVGVIGLLARAYLSGQHFFELKAGQRVDVVYGDGRSATYRVTEVYRYQATAPNSITSDFMDLDTHKHLSAANLFSKVYRGSNHVTFQTCIERPGSSSWGRLFVVAEPEATPD